MINAYFDTELAISITLFITHGILTKNIYYLLLQLFFRFFTYIHIVRRNLGEHNLLKIKFGSYAETARGPCVNLRHTDP